MKAQSGKLQELRVELLKIINEAERGKLTNAEAAERITEVREAMDQVIRNLKSKAPTPK
jgi:hypothetical protein